MENDFRCAEEALNKALKIVDSILSSNRPLSDLISGRLEEQLFELLHVLNEASTKTGSLCSSALAINQVIERVELVARYAAAVRIRIMRTKSSRRVLSDLDYISRHLEYIKSTILFALRLLRQCSLPDQGTSASFSDAP